MLHDGAQDHRLQVRPLAPVLGHADEIASQEHFGDPIDLEQAQRQRRNRGLLDGGEVGGAPRQHLQPGQELQGLGIGRRFGLNEHDRNPRVIVGAC